MVTVVPYEYNQEFSNRYLAGNGILTNNSASDDKQKQSVSATATNKKYAGVSLSNFEITRTGGDSLNNNIFRGFTLTKANLQEKGSVQNTNGTNTKIANTFTYVIKPNGLTNIEIYYTRNDHKVTYHTDGANANNPTLREYQVGISLKNPINNHSNLLANGSGDDAGGTNQTGLGDFYG